MTVSYRIWHDNLCKGDKSLLMTIAFSYPGGDCMKYCIKEVIFYSIFCLLAGYFKVMKFL